MKSFSEAFQSDINAETGGWRECQEFVCRKISALTRGATGMWVGIASRGDNGVRDRWNAKYRELGMYYIAIVYEMGSDRFRKQMEDSLIDFYRNNFARQDIMHNVVGGGGGPEGTPPYSVYAAWRDA